MKLLKSWSIPLVISIALFLGLRPVFAQIIMPESESNDTLFIGSEIEKNGVMQVYFIKDDVRYYITDKSYTSETPEHAGDYIVWMGQAIEGAWQVFLYHIPTAQTTQITSSGNNQNPRVSDTGQVVWEGWVSDKWQVFFFDGIRTTQLTSGDISVNPEIEGDYISFGRKDITGTWRSVIYSISKGRSVDVKTGIASKYPKIKNGKIFLGEGGSEKEFDLTVEDLFILDLTPLTATGSGEILLDEIPVGSTESAEAVSVNIPETVTFEEIIQELEATESGEFRI